MKKIILLTLLFSAELFSQLQREWSVTYDDSVVTEDVVQSSAVDKFGNYYLIGVSYGHESQKRVIIKYDSSGNIQWKTNAIQAALATIVVDSQFNVYCAGRLDTNAFLAKISPLGNIIWQHQYFDSLSGRNRFTNITLDENGDVYATGRTFFSENLNGIIIMKIRSSGERIWSRFSTGLCGAVAILSSKDGSIYCAGWGDGHCYGFIGSTYSMLMKYDTSGVLQWARKYGGENDEGDEEFEKMLLFPSNKIALSATIVNDYTYASVVLTYDENGNLGWEKFFPIDSSYRYKDYTIDENNNVYVVGNIELVNDSSDGIFLTSYNGLGEQRWFTQFRNDGAKNAISLSTNSNGNSTIIATISNSQNFIIPRFDSSGNFLFTNFIGDTLSGTFRVQKVDYSPTGRVYISGDKEFAFNAQDIYTLSAASNGQSFWKQSYNSYASARNDITGFAIDGSRSAYVVGSGNYHYTPPVKFNRDGMKLWEAEVDSEIYLNQFSEPQIVLDNQNNCIVGASNMFLGSRRDSDNIC
ncbi:MAG: hypothetical protein KGZ58_02910 [Ignavibacteriales bacterium]|nr:hypothetical protein [Ignavibacteriales bacterium]